MALSDFFPFAKGDPTPNFEDLISMIQKGGIERQKGVKQLIKQLLPVRYGKETAQRFHYLKVSDFDEAFADAIIDLEKYILERKITTEEIPSKTKTYFLRNLIDISRKKANNKEIYLSPEAWLLLGLMGGDGFFKKEPDPCLVLVFSKLSKKARIVLEDYYYEDLSLQEIAEKYYKNNEHTAAVSLFNFRQDFKKHLTKLCQQKASICKDICHHHNL